MNLSFSGCGFLGEERHNSHVQYSADLLFSFAICSTTSTGIYHVGVAISFKEYASHLLVEKISGASAGALAAVGLLCDLPLGMWWFCTICSSPAIQLVGQQNKCD